MHYYDIPLPDSGRGEGVLKALKSFFHDLTIIFDTICLLSHHDEGVTYRLPCHKYFGLFTCKSLLLPVLTIFISIQVAQSICKNYFFLSSNPYFRSNFFNKQKGMFHSNLTQIDRYWCSFQITILFPIKIRFVTHQDLFQLLQGLYHLYNENIFFIYFSSDYAALQLLLPPVRYLFSL